MSTFSLGVLSFNYNIPLLNYFFPHFFLSITMNVHIFSVCSFFLLPFQKLHFPVFLFQLSLKLIVNYIFPVCSFLLITIKLITFSPVFSSFNYHFNYIFLYVFCSANYHAAVAYKVQASMVVSILTRQGIRYILC